MNILISGGCKNGKSFHAQRVARSMALADGRPLYYVATMIPTDEEDRARIRRHVAERDGWGFQTVEQGRHILACLKKVDPTGVFLVDSVTALLSNEMFPADGPMDLAAAARVAGELAEFAQRTGHTVFVSDYIYSDARDFEEMTACYRRGLALADRTLAQVCEQVIEVAYGATYLFKDESGGETAGATTEPSDSDADSPDLDAADAGRAADARGARAEDAR